MGDGGVSVFRGAVRRLNTHRVIDGFVSRWRIVTGTGGQVRPGEIRFFNRANIHTGGSLPAAPRPPFNFSPFALQEDDDGEDYGQPTHLEVKLEQPDFKTEHTSPEPDQTEPVDLSLNKPRSSSAQVSKSSATVNPAPSSTQPGLSATPVPSTVQSIGSMVTEPPPLPH